MPSCDSDADQTQYMTLYSQKSIIYRLIFNSNAEHGCVILVSFGEGVMVRGYPARPLNRSSCLQVHCVMQRARSSQVEGELVEVHIAGDGANLRAEAGNLVCEHAGGRNLDRIIPVVVVVTQGVREVKDGHLADIRRVLGDVEVCRLDGTLGDGVRHEEEVELAIDDLGLLDEASVNVGTLWRVINEVLVLVAL